MNYLPVPSGYRCPLCPNHQDEKSARHSLVEQPLCQGCLIELDHYAKFSSEELGERKRRWSEEFARLAGPSWDECRRFILCNEIADWEAIRQNPSGRWWATMMRNGWWSHEQCEGLVEETLAELREALQGVAEAAAPDAHGPAAAPNYPDHSD